jgi:hypothetical protein
VLTYFEPVNAIRNLAVLARRRDSRTEVCVLQGDAALVAARGIDNLSGRNGTVGVDPVAPSPTVGCGRVGDLLAVTRSRAGENFAIPIPLLGTTPISRLAVGALPRQSIPARLSLPKLDSSPEYRRCGRSLRTAMPNAFFCPTSTSSRLPRVIPV